jgi:hypothetical protein
MGSWGTAIFADDTACDVRDRFIELVAGGASAPNATNQLLQEFVEEGEEPVFWLALAATEFRYGLLEDRVKTQALKIIDSGQYLTAWSDDTKLLKRRAKELATLRSSLVGPQRRPKPIKKPFKDATPWLIGDLITYRLGNGEFIAVRVIGHHTDRGGTSPVFEMLDWVGKEPPSKATVARCRVKRGMPPYQHIGQFCVGRLLERELPANRVQRLEFRGKPEQKLGEYAALRWRTLDAQLQMIFGLGGRVRKR